MQYAALLRGINVGGNAPVKMSELKLAFEKAGYTSVLTYINSGNVIFESQELNVEKITHHLEEVVSKEFKFEIKVVVVPETDLAEILLNVPHDWKTKKDIRCYVAFLKDHVKTQDVISEITLKEGVDTVKAGSQVIYMTTLMSGLTKSGFTKLIGKKVYKDITMRNYNTVQKLRTLMES